MINTMTGVEKTGFILVLLMVLLQGVYGTFAYFDPATFSSLRGQSYFQIRMLTGLKYMALELYSSH